MSAMANAFQIEKCQEVAFADALATIGAETFSDAFGHLYKPADLNAFLNEHHSAVVYEKLLRDPHYGVWAVKDDVGRLMAYMVAGPCNLPAPELPANSGELIRLYTRKEHQGKGLGMKMLDIALAWLDAHFARTYLSVYAGNHGAQKLYKRYGFEIVHEYSFMVGNHADPEFIMKRV